MVEVIDPDARRVVVRSQLDGYIINPLPEGRAAMYEEDDRGGRVIVVQLELRER